MLKKNVERKGWQYVILALGLPVRLKGTLLTWDRNILGEETAGCARGMAGIGVVGTFDATFTGAERR